MKKRIFAAIAILVTCGASGMYANEIMIDDELGRAAATDIKAAWKDADGWCPAGCDASKYKCPCAVIN